MLLRRTCFYINFVELCPNPNFGFFGFGNVALKSNPYKGKLKGIPMLNTIKKSRLIIEGSARFI